METKFDIHSLEGQRDELKAKNTIYGAGWFAAISAKLFTDGLHFTGEISFRNGNPSQFIDGRSRQEAEERCRDAAEKATGNK
jgi:hypothetical protein